MCVDGGGDGGMQHETIYCPYCSSHLAYPADAALILCPTCNATLDPNFTSQIRCTGCQALLAYPPNSQCIQCPKVTPHDDASSSEAEQHTRAELTHDLRVCVHVACMVWTVHENDEPAVDERDNFRSCALSRWCVGRPLHPLCDTRPAMYPSTHVLLFRSCILVLAMF